jgi:tetrahydromethanopterin S-methyltransferase subunit F
MLPVMSLPPSYEKIGKLDLSRDLKLLAGLQVLGLIGLAVSIVFFGLITALLRPDGIAALFSRRVEVGDGSSLTFRLPIEWIAGFAAAVVLMVVLHEAVHGLFFWLFTGKRPRFGFKVIYAYAALPPGVYLPRNSYLVAGAAPLVLLGLVGTALIPYLSQPLLPALLFFLVGNTSGSIGDLYVIAWLLRKPASVLVADRGDAVDVYGMV